jgi:hypothetical protein
MPRKNRTSFNAKSASEAARKRWQKPREPEAPEVPTEEETPAQTLRRLSLDPKVPAYAQVQAAKALSMLPDVEAENHWRASPQVRPDYTPPTWEEILEVARKAGAV